MKKILAFFRQFYIAGRFYWLGGIVVGLFCLSFFWTLLFPFAQVALVVLCALFLVDLILLFNNRLVIDSKRELPKVMSLGDEHDISIHIQNKYGLPLKGRIIDELPNQFQERDFEIPIDIPPHKTVHASYKLRPLERGVYNFGELWVFVRSLLGVLERRIGNGAEKDVPVYPSIRQMNEYEAMAFQRNSMRHGLKKFRRIGHSYEFDQIKNYVKGDDFRSINWKATGRRSEVMVNQYEDERSQQVYCIIDKGRSMKLPFNGLSLFEYAINTSLVISRIASRKHDKAGLITFSNAVGSFIKADRRPTQINLILETLYNEKERKHESNFELLFQITKKVVTTRSLMLLFTNFESLYAMERVLPILRKINSRHLLVVIFFENTEISDYVGQDADDIRGVYQQTLARQFIHDKKKIVATLLRHGIQALITKPEELSMNTVNKYLELKARGLI